MYPHQRQASNPVTPFSERDQMPININSTNNNSTFMNRVQQCNNGLNLFGQNYLKSNLPAPGQFNPQAQQQQQQMSMMYSQNPQQQMLQNQQQQYLQKQQYQYLQQQI